MRAPQTTTAPPRPRRATARRAVAAAGAACLALGVATFAAGPAVADVDPATVDEGLWYYTRTGIAEAHQQTTGQGITIAVIDGTINPAAPDLVGTNLQTTSICPADDGTMFPSTSTDESAEHATKVVAMIVGTGAGSNGRLGTRGVAPGATVLHYAINPPGYEEGAIGGINCRLGGEDVVGAVDQAVAAGAKIITTSIGNLTPSAEYSEDWEAAVLRAQAAGAVILAATPNDASSGDALGMPADLNGVVTVGNHDINGAAQGAANGPYLTVVAPGTAVRTPVWVDGDWSRYALTDGTSLATPWTAGVLALAWSLHPDATANQMIQALIHTTATTPEGGEPVHDDTYGYGPVSVPRLLAVDPTTFPDDNPLLHPLDDPEARPSTAEILQATGKPVPQETTEPTAEPTTAPADTQPDQADDTDESETGLLLPVLIGLGAVLLLAAAIIIAVIVRRRTTAPTASTIPTGEDA